MKSDTMRMVEQGARTILRKHDVSLKTGFLAKDPLPFLPMDADNAKRDKSFTDLDTLAHYPLHKLIKDGDVVQAVSRLDVPTWSFNDLPKQVVFRLMLVYAMLTHAYFREILPYKNVDELMKDESVKHLPSQLAVPLWELSKITGIAPSMSYPLYALRNWTKKDPSLPLSLENVEMIHSFTGTIDENWFVAVHHIVEVEAVPAILALLKAHLLAELWNNGQEVTDEDMASYLSAAARAENKTVDVLERMREHCDYKTYFDSVRLFYSFPCKVVFEGVNELGGEPQEILGETGGQSPSRHFRLLAVGIRHETDAYFPKMRLHMSSPHRELLELIYKSQIRQFVLDRRHNTRLVRRYNALVQSVIDWRVEHLSQVDDYIKVYGEMHGTGKPPLNWLIKLKDEAREFIIK